MAGNRNKALQIGALVAAGFMATCTGSSGGGGPGERTAVAPAALGVSSASLELLESTSSCQATQVQDALKVVNNGSTGIKFSDISIKLWVDETSAANVVASVSGNAGGGCISGHGANSPDCSGGHVSGVTATAVRMATACGPASNQEANWEVTITNTDSSSLPAGQAWQKFDINLSLSNHADFSPGAADWYSGCLGDSFADTTHTAIYVQGNLVTASTGVPPSCVAPSGTQPVPGSVPPSILNGTFPLVGPVPPATPLTVTIAMPLVPQVAGQPAIDDFIGSLYDPTSPSYHAYLTPSQFADAYGTDPGSYGMVQSFATSSGLTVQSTYPSRTLLTVTGTAAAIESAFFVTLNQYMAPSGNVFYAPANDPSVNLGIPLSHIGGLDNFATPRPASTGSGPGACAAGISDPGGAHPVPAQTADFGGSDFKTAYLNATAVGMRGTGQTVAILAFDSVNTVDTDAYHVFFDNGNPAYKLNQIPVLMNPCASSADCLTGQTCTVGRCAFSGTPGSSPPFGSDGNELEVAASVEMVAATVPDATINVYEVSPFLTTGQTQLSASAYEQILAAAANETTSPAQVIANSWLWQGIIADPVVADIFKQFAVQGQSFFQAAGDFGSYVSTGPTGETINNAIGGVNGYVGGVTVPDPISDSVLMTVVGATGLTTNGSRVRTAETAWNDASTRGIAPADSPVWLSVTGGGLLSGYGGTAYPPLRAPSYQNALTLSTEITNAQTATGLGYNVRMIPDVSIVGAQIAVYGNGGLSPCQEGTSLAAPIWAGIAAIINESAGVSPTSPAAPLGYANPKLYAAAAAAGPGTECSGLACNFNDIADNSDNDYAATTDGAGAKFHAGALYDLVTGLGSPTASLVTSTSLATQSCMPGANLTALVTGRYVIGFMPNGSYGSYAEATESDIRVVPIESPTGLLPPSYNTAACAGRTGNTSGCSCDANGCTVYTTPGDGINTCSGDSVSGNVVCVGNSNYIYTLSGLTIGNTFSIPGLTPESESFSGGSCTTCNVVIDPNTQNAFVSFETNAGLASLQPVLNATSTTMTPTLGTAIGLNGQEDSSEGLVIDPTRKLVLSANEEGDYQLIQLNSGETAGTAYDSAFSSAISSPIFDQSAEDCTTGIALASVEVYGTNTGGPGQIFLVDLVQASIPSAPMQWNTSAYNLITVPEFSAFVAGTDGITVASPSHLGAITGEYGGNAFGVFLLPFQSGSGTPSLNDWVVGTIPNTPMDGATWAMGLDPHTITSYTSPNNNKQYVVFQDDADQDGTRTWLAVIDMAAMLFTVPRTDGLTPSTGTTMHTLPAGALSAIPIGTAGSLQCMGPPAGTPGCVVGFVHN